MKTPAVVAVSWHLKNGGKSFDVYGLGIDNQITGIRFFGTGWGAWEPLEKVLSSPVAAVSGGEDRIDIFGLDVSNRMVHRAWAEDQFVPINSWEFLQGGRFNSAPAVVTSPPFAIDLFALSNTNTMHHNYSFGSGAWVTPDPVNWHEIKQNFFSSPPAAAFSGGRIHVVALGQDNRLLYNSGKPADPNSWGNWKSLLKVMLSPLAIVPGVRPAGTGVRPTIVIFGLDESNRMWFWEGAGTETDPNEIAGNWHQLPGLICSSPPAVVSVGTSRIDVFVLDTSNRMRHQARIGVSGEFPNIWDLLGGIFSSPPVAVSKDPDRIDIFGLGIDNAMYHKAFAGGQFFPSQLSWEPLGGVFMHP